MEHIKMKFSTRIMIAITLLLIGLFSFFVISKVVMAPNFNAATIESLNDKRDTVMKLAVTAAASSTALSMIPGETATPIANEIAKLASYFIVILGAILLQKTLIGVVGFLSFKIIIPFACLLGLPSLFVKEDELRYLAIKLAIFGIVLFAAIPVSIQVSDIIYNSNQATINEAIETAQQNEQYIAEKKQGLYKEDQNWFEKAITYVYNSFSNIGKRVAEMVKAGEETLTAFLDAIAVMIITACVIPIVVILIFAWIIKILFGFDMRGALTVFRLKS